MANKNQVKWTPVASFSALLFLLFAGGCLVSIVVGAALIVAIMTIYGFFATIAPDHHRQLFGLWSDSISPVVHWILISIFIVFSGLIAALLFSHYHLNITLERDKAVS